MISDDLTAAWLALAADSGDEQIRMIPAGVQVDGGAVTAGRDRQGREHLLVPVIPGSAVPTDQRSAKVTLERRELLASGRRTLYSDLTCHDPLLHEVFVRLAAEVCEALGTDPGGALEVPARVLNRWRDLLADRPGGLSTDQTVGLFGELWLLRETVRRDASRRTDHWHGPDRALHDFVVPGLAVEVKTSTAREDRTVQIHGLGQLDHDPGQELHLVFLRVTRPGDDGNGLSLDGLVDELLRIAIDHVSLTEQLAAAGWRPDTISGRTPWQVSEEVLYSVVADFPRITSAQLVSRALPMGVGQLRYSVELAAAVPAKAGALEQILDRLARR